MENACYVSPALKEWISTLLLLSCPDSDTSRAYPRPFLFGGTGVLASPLPVSSAASAAGLGYQLPNQRHFLQRIPVTGKKVKPQRRCIVCKDAGVRRESRFYCSACPGGPGFCRTGPCFMTHHRMMGCIFDKHLLIWRKIWTENKYWLAAFVYEEGNSLDGKILVLMLVIESYVRMFCLCLVWLKWVRDW